MRPLRRLASRLRRSVRQRLFGNFHSVAVNLRYRRYARLARRSWQPSLPPAEAERATAEDFRRRGYAVLPPPLLPPERIAALSARVDALFAQPGGTLQIGAGLYRLLDGLAKLPEIVDLLDAPLERVIESYYGSHFKIFGVYFYHTEPCAARPQSSFLWHTDNCPAEEIKLMIYLDPVTARSGAIRLKPGPLSDALRRQGFVERGRYEGFRAALDDPETTEAVEGPAGTRILFQNGRTIHKAVLPEERHRDVVTFVIIPSTIPWRAHFERNRHLLTTNQGICLDPYSDRPQSIGHRE